MVILFVHGTGVREIEYAETLRRIQEKLPLHTVSPCLWGDSCGARLNAGGATIPGYPDGPAGPLPDQEQAALARWFLLYQDPLFELRLLEQRKGERRNLPPSAMQPGERAVALALDLQPAPAFLDRLKHLGLEHRWVHAYRTVVDDPAFKALLHGANLDPLDTTLPIARAIVAALVGPVTPAVTGKTRDELVAALRAPLGGQPLGPLEWGAGMYFRWKERNRRELYDSHATKVTDILHYQVRGQAIRDYLQRRIGEVSDGPKSVTLLCHSLGGIAAVDLLVQNPIPEVRQLITVGSQAGFLYETNCLVSLAFGESLPDHFPPWRNIYDPADFLSYRASDVFPSRATDFPADNGQPFPSAHSAYWDNPEVIAEIERRLR